MSVLEVHNVSIRYMTGDFKDIGLKEYVMRRLTKKYQVHEFWADRNITFSLEKGELLGIIGSNGAGKSTLLKVVSGIMEPTEGKVERNGSVAALLELASGFDRELTVKENAYLRGAMLGYTRKFMDEAYDQIIEFAELKGFQDRPFKQLSSGMKARLAFSIASLVSPDILILDEVLSVGDGAFRKKSEKKMQEIIRGGAATILVSHSLEQIRRLCSKVLWLEKGRQIALGETGILCDLYQQYLDKTFTLNFCKDFLANPPQFGQDLSYRVNHTETDKKHKIGESTLATESSTVIDILQRKITQLENTVDRKNSEISTWKNKLLSLQRRLRKYETFNEWEYIEHFGKWEARSFAMSSYIKPECQSLLDLGCGEMHIRKYLNDQVKYYGCDYKKRDEETIVCDLAKGEFPSICVDTIFIAGVLEYLVNWREVLKKCSQHCTQLIMSYCTIESAPERSPVWVTSISYQEIVDEMLQNGFELVSKSEFKLKDVFNDIFNFEKSVK